jgi:diacylglycerol kinase
MLNSALEKLCDLVMPEQHVKIKYIKDVAAGAVLIACVFAVIVAILVFYPYLKL